MSTSVKKGKDHILLDGKNDPTAVQLVFNPFSQFVPQLVLYCQLQLTLWSYPISLSVSKSTLCVIMKIQGAGNIVEIQMKKVK